MQCAAILSHFNVLEEFRNMSHKKLDEWIDDLEAGFRENPNPSLVDLSDLFQKSRTQFLSACMGAATERLYPDYMEQEWADCPRCGKKVYRKRMDKKIVSTMQGAFELERPYFYCRTCKHGFCPLDEKLAVSTKRHQYDIQKRIAQTAAKAPFEESAGIFQELSGIAIGNHFSHETLNAVGDTATVEMVIPDANEITGRIDQMAVNQSELPVLVVTADGAHAPTRPKAPRKAKRGKGSYQEAKGFRVYLFDSADRIRHIASWHQIGDAANLSKAVQIISDRIPRNKVRMVLIGDGASWVWNVLTQHFPEAVQILDFYHCYEHLHQVARAQYGEGSQRGHEWAEMTMIQLCEGDYKRVIKKLASIKPVDAASQEEIRKLIGYLENQGHRINYFKEVKAGNPIGSGAIESANKFICHTRLKRSGAWWIRENGNSMLRIRCAIYNGTFNKVFEHYQRIHSELRSG